MAKRGRPTKYKPEFCEKMIDFFDQPIYEDVKINHYKNDKLIFTDIKRLPTKLPTLTDFCKSLNLPYFTVREWLDKKCKGFKIEFSQAFMYARTLQKNHLIQASLMGLYNPIFAKFTAVNLTDMRDKKEEEVKYTGKQEILIDIKPEDLQEKINLVKRLKDANIERVDAHTIN